MDFAIKIAHIVISILLITAVLLQNKGGGVGGAFGGAGGSTGGGGAYLTKRGLEKKLHIATIVLAVIFILLSLAVFMTA